MKKSIFLTTVLLSGAILWGCTATEIPTINESIKQSTEIPAISESTEHSTDHSVAESVSSEIFTETSVNHSSTNAFAELTEQTQNSDGYWIYKPQLEDDIVYNFRFMDEDFKDFRLKKFTGNVDDISRKGLDDLRISASSNPNSTAMKALYHTIQERAGEDAPIYIFDLRGEYHGYINDQNACWSEENNWGTLGMSRDEIIENEKVLFDSIVGSEVILIPEDNGGFLKDYDLKELKENVAKVALEKDVAEEAGFIYVRYATPDHAFISPEYIDEFLELYKMLPDNAWLHFHCSVGVGRTGIMCMIVDMLENRDISFDDIVARQYLLGAGNLLRYVPVTKEVNFATNERRLTLKLFYDYIHDGSYDKGIKWSDYLKEL